MLFYFSHYYFVKIHRPSSVIIPKQLIVILSTLPTYRTIIVGMYVFKLNLWILLRGPSINEMKCCFPFSKGFQYLQIIFTFSYLLYIKIMGRHLILSRIQQYVIVQCLYWKQLGKMNKNENIYKSRLLGGNEGWMFRWGRASERQLGSLQAPHPGVLLISDEEQVDLTLGRDSSSKY